MWTCRNCRTENDDNTTTCAHCGEKMVPPAMERKATIPSEAKTLRNTATTIMVVCIVASIISPIVYGLDGLAVAFVMMLSAFIQYAVLFALARIVVDVNRIRREKTGSDDDD